MKVENRRCRDKKNIPERDKREVKKGREERRRVVSQKYHR
jgi:hypothetical protein